MNTQEPGDKDRSAPQHDDFDPTGSDSQSVEEPLPRSEAVEPAPPPSTTSKIRERLTGFAWLSRIVLNAVVLVVVGIGLIAGVGVAQRIGWLTSGESQSSGSPHDHGEAVYTCPMHPQIRMNQPGKCPICRMKLVLVSDTKGSSSPTSAGDRYICPMMCTPASTEAGRCPVCAMELVAATGGGDADGTAVTVDPVARRMVGVRTTKATSETVFQTIRTIGRISYDESKLATISAYVDGRLEKMYADYVGVPVSENDDLALIYSPQLFSAQVEYLTTLDSGAISRLSNGDIGRMTDLAKENLVELGMTDQQIEDLTRNRKANSRSRIKSPITGTVIEKHKVEGDYVKMGDMIYKVADLSTVWLMLDLYPDDASRIRFGQQVEAEFQSMPSQVFTGRVAVIDPMVDITTRTVSVRVEMLNPGGKLRPGDYATARIAAAAIPQDLVYDPSLAGKYISPMHPQIIMDAPGDCPVCGMDLIPTTRLGYATEPIPDQEVVTVPRQAVLMAGDNSVVYVETEPGRFETRRVIVGPLSDTQAIILEGISTGEVVAVDGNFLIDSQMQLAGNPSLLDPSRAALYPQGPLLLPTTKPTRLSGAAASHFDDAFAAYFAIQRSLANDRTPEPVSLTLLSESLHTLLASSDVPDPAQRQLEHARRGLAQMAGPLDQVRRGFRILSHGMLRAAAIARGQTTADKLIHFYCHMVPGGGGDWMQPDGELRNPYWGSEMLQCGEQVADLNLNLPIKPAP